MSKNMIDINTLTDILTDKSTLNKSKIQCFAQLIRQSSNLKKATK